MAGFLLPVINVRRRNSAYMDLFCVFMYFNCTDSDCSPYKRRLRNSYRQEGRSVYNDGCCNRWNDWLPVFLDDYGE